jgi:hypothetical protein
MRISRDENPDFYDKLFGDIGRYEQWAPYFYKEFVTEYSRLKGRPAGVMTTCEVRVIDSLDDEFELWLDSKDIFLHSIYPPRTAEYINKWAIKGYLVFRPYSDDPYRLRVKPTAEVAKAYVDCASIIQYHYENVFPEGMERLSPEEHQNLFKKEEEFSAMGLDMRDEVFEENGKVGLRRVTGEVVVPALFDEIPEQYDYIGIIHDSWELDCVPVVRNHKFALCKTDGKGTLVTDFVYDRLFRYFYSRYNYFIGVKGSKKGVIDLDGKEIVPCEMDEIYEMIDRDGCMPLKKGDKWGLVFYGVATEVIYDDYKIESGMGMVKKDGKWFYVDYNGKPVADIDHAYFESDYDISK